MFDILTRELGARFGTGEQSGVLLRTVLAYMTNKETGGLIGFLEQFKKAGLGPVVQSWLGNTVSPKSLTNSQVEQVLGGSGSLLDLLSHRVSAPRDNLAGAVAYLLPALVAKLTPGGSIPNQLPAEVVALMGDTKALLALPVESAASTGGGLGKWLPVVIGAVVVAAGLAYCTQQSSHDASPVQTPPAAVVDAPGQEASAPSQAAPAPEAALPAAPDSASAPAATQSLDAASQSASTGGVSAPVLAASEPATDASAISVDLKEAPAHAGVMAGAAHGIPLLQVFFDSGVSALPSEFAEKAAALVAYVQANPSVTVAVSGFNDASGDPELNAKLSKERAEAVRTALLAQGLEEARVVLEKPTEPTEGHAAAARRVNVVIRH